MKKNFLKNKKLCINRSGRVFICLSLRLRGQKFYQFLK